MPVFPARLPFDHYKWQPGTGQDTHGNDRGQLSETPIPRMAIAFYPHNSQEPVSADTVTRYVTELFVLVKNPELFGEQDEIEIRGVRFQVDGDESAGDWRDGPWPRYNRLFGGRFKATRVG